MRIGYLISSHVLQNHAIIPPLLKSMNDCGIGGDQILVVVNGSGQPHEYEILGTRFIFQTGEFQCHFNPLLERDFGFTHFFFVNGTSRCGPRFRELVESGFNPEDECTLAGALIPLGSFGTEGRAINDLCMYRHDYLVRQKPLILEMSAAGGATVRAICEMEGVLYAVAQKRGKYPVIGHDDTGPTDVYGTGTMRLTEYYPGIDWYRFKKNWGQREPGTFKASML